MKHSEVAAKLAVDGAVCSDRRHGEGRARRHFAAPAQGRTTRADLGMQDIEGQTLFYEVDRGRRVLLQSGRRVTRRSGSAGGDYDKGADALDALP
jgi:hypothetical protein